MEQSDDWSHGLYKQYKTKTETAMRWLIEKGTSLGYNPKNQQRPQKLPEVSSRDIVSLASHIAEQKTVVQVPRHIIWDIEDAITGRVHAAAWYQSILLREQRIKDDQRHWHFIRVLETILNILRPFIESRPQNASKSVEDRDRKSKVTQQNIFGFLHSERLDVKEKNEPRTSVRPQAQNERRHGTQYRYKPDEKDGQEELYLFFYCLLQDLGEMRQAVRLVWLRYRQRFSSLETAATVSKTAMLLAKRLEDDFWKNCLDKSERKEAMGELFDKLREPDTSTSDTSKSIDKLGLALTSTHEILTKAHHRHLSLRNRKWPKSEDISGSESFLIPVSLQAPECDLLVKIFHAYRKYFNVRPESRLFDAFSEGLKDIIFARTEQLVPIWLAFAARIVIDQLLVFKDNSSPVEDSSNTFWRIEDSAKQFIGYKPRRMEENVDWIQDHYKTFYLQDEECEPTIEIMECNATFTGFHALYGLADLQTLTFKVNNQGEYMLPLAHLYYFLINEGYLEERWSDMDMIIDTHGINHMFVGGLPTQQSQYVKKLELASGYSLRKFSKGQRKSKRYFSEKNRRCLNDTSLPISLIFARNLKAWHSSPEPFPLYSLELVLRALGDGMQVRVDMAGQLQNQPELVQRLRKVPPLTSGKMLSLLHKLLDREIPRIQIDYFQLERQYRRLLFQVRQIYLSSYPHDRCTFDENNELGELRHVVPRIISSRLEDQCKNCTCHTKEEKEKAPALMQTVAKKMGKFCRNHGAEQTTSILKLRPKFRFPIFPPNKTTGSQNEQEQESDVDIPSCLYPLRDAMLKVLPLDPQIVPLDEWIQETEGPPQIHLDERILQQCISSCVTAMYCAAGLSLLALAFMSREEAQSKPGKGIPDGAVTDQLAPSPKVPTRGPSTSKRNKSVRRKR